MLLMTVSAVQFLSLMKVNPTSEKYTPTERVTLKNGGLF